MKRLCKFVSYLYKRFFVTHINLLTTFWNRRVTTFPKRYYLFNIIHFLSLAFYIMPYRPNAIDDLKLILFF